MSLKVIVKNVNKKVETKSKINVASMFYWTSTHETEIIGL